VATKPASPTGRSAAPFIAIALGMLMLAYASVPLYRLFCQVTGFGGTTRRVEANFSSAVSAQTMHVRFNSDTDTKLPWSFVPIEREVTVHLGENRLVAFKVRNESNQPTRGTATFNVVPNLAGKYFNKIQCFCFEEQRLNPGEEVIMPVSFFIDPAILDDPDLKGLTNITLSYTFFSYDSANHPK
jgi:cytochrome c oxidase assembly protein subunit 11